MDQRMRKAIIETTTATVIFAALLFMLVFWMAGGCELKIEVVPR